MRWKVFKGKASSNIVGRKDIRNKSSIISFWKSKLKPLVWHASYPAVLTTNADHSWPSRLRVDLNLDSGLCFLYTQGLRNVLLLAHFMKPVELYFPPPSNPEFICKGAFWKHLLLLKKFFFFFHFSSTFWYHASGYAISHIETNLFGSLNILYDDL